MNKRENENKALITKRMRMNKSENGKELELE